jgi:hypothetical protein
MIMFPPLSTIYVENVPEYFYKLPVYNLIVTITHPTVSLVLPNNAIVTRVSEERKTFLHGISRGFLEFDAYAPGNSYSFTDYLNT